MAGTKGNNGDWKASCLRSISLSLINRAHLPFPILNNTGRITLTERL